MRSFRPSGFRHAHADEGGDRQPNYESRKMPHGGCVRPSARFGGNIHHHIDRGIARCYRWRRIEYALSSGRKPCRTGETHGAAKRRSHRSHRKCVRPACLSDPDQIWKLRSRSASLLGRTIGIPGRNSSRALAGLAGARTVDLARGETSPASIRRKYEQINAKCPPGKIQVPIWESRSCCNRKARRR